MKLSLGKVDRRQGYVFRFIYFHEKSDRFVTLIGTHIECPVLIAPISRRRLWETVAQALPYWCIHICKVLYCLDLENRPQIPGFQAKAPQSLGHIRVCHLTPFTCHVSALLFPAVVVLCSIEGVSDTQ